ncbi:MAG: hypothetical protein IJD31_07625, partial [Lachnospiraceae bacterium]|nr:hypothetical protein [Lachnospiraceae bacterium]
MLYCVKCGDPIEKDELICDKCGYHFTIVEGSPAKVYMNQVPGKAPAQNKPTLQQPVMSQGQGSMQRFMPPQGSAVIPQEAGRPQGSSAQGQPMQGRPAQGQPVQGRPVQGQPVQGRPMQGQPVQGRPIQGQQMQGRPMQAQPPMRRVNARPKKKKNGFIIAAAITGGVILTACLCVVIFFGAFLITGGLMMDSGDEIVVNDYNDENYTEPEAPVVHDNSNENTASDEGYVADAIRDPFVTLKGDNQDEVTIMIYMNGSNLESDHGMATEDIREILSATLSENVNVVIQTGGTRKWKTKAIASDHSQRFIVENGALTLVDDSLGQLDITDPQTLEDFIVFCDTYYPANRNMLIMWNHGSGAVYGFGYDEHSDDYMAALTLDEMQTAIRNTGVKFEMIGFDACLMGGIETACAFYDSADYLIASEDFES